MFANILRHCSLIHHHILLFWRYLKFWTLAIPRSLPYPRQENDVYLKKIPARGAGTREGMGGGGGKLSRLQLSRGPPPPPRRSTAATVGDLVRGLPAARWSLPVSGGWDWTVLFSLDHCSWKEKKFNHAVDDKISCFTVCRCHTAGEASCMQLLNPMRRRRGFNFVTKKRYYYNILQQSMMNYGCAQ